MDDQHNDPEDPVFEFESRIVADGYAYWLSKLRDGRLPSRTALRPAEIPRLLPHVMLLDVQRTPRWDFRFRLIGTQVVEHLHSDYTGSWMSENEHHRHPDKVWTNCLTVAETAKPLYPSTPYAGPREEFRRAEDILLPLADDGLTVDGLLTFIAFLPRA